METPTGKNSAPEQEENGATKAEEGTNVSPPRILSLQEFEQTYFFRWLKGDYDHLGVWRFPPERGPQADSTHGESTTAIDTTSMASHGIQPFLSFKKLAESIATDVGSQAKLVFTSRQPFVIPSQASESDSAGTSSHTTGQIPSSSSAKSGFNCDACNRSISDTEHGFHCSICDNGDFDLCQDCIDRGSGCKDGSHLLHMTVGYGHRGGKNVRIFGSRKILKELRSSPGPQWEDGTLESALDSYLEKVDATSHLRANDFYFTDSHSKTKFGPVRMLRKWAQICVLLAEDHFVPSFRSTLTPLQLASVRLLLEWWMGEIQDFRLTFMGVHGYLIGLSVLLVKGEKVGETIREETAIRRFVGGAEKSPYHSHLCGLFSSEFDHEPPSSRGPDQKPRLHFLRETAANLACTQRAALRLCHLSPLPPWLGETNIDSIGDIFDAAFARYRQMLMTSGIPMAYLMSIGFLADSYLDAFDKACKGSVLLATENFLQFEQVLSKNTLSSNLVSCPWLSRAEAFSHRPHFLWDVRGQKTVRVADMKFEPIYTAISHTWGRWRLEGESADIPGVPWPVPRNSRFSVDLIPTILEKVPGGTPYIWFDLVCIPQDTVQDLEMAQLRRQEVARQAGIFNNAEHAIAWFSDMQETASLRKMAQVLAANALQFPPLVDKPGIGSLVLAEAGGCYCAHPLMKSERPEAEGSIWEIWQDHIHEWFTSLWTLQEVCMRPDMWLCGKDWETMLLPVDAPTEPGGIISMDALLSLLLRTYETLESVENLQPIWAEPQVIRSNLMFRYGNSSACENIVKVMPWIVGVFHGFMERCGLLNLPSITPGNILVLGNNRFCQEGRAEAIMSVLGATKWFHAASSPTATPLPLILGRYPVSFVEEVRGRLGHDVFFGLQRVAKRAFNYPDAEAILTNYDSARTHFAGSLLPFGDSLGSDVQWAFGLFLGGGSVNEPHGSLAAWQVREDGSTLIPTASLLASSLMLRSPISRANSSPNVQAEITDRHRNGDQTASKSGKPQSLKEWICSRSYDVYAVCLLCKSVDTLTDSRSPRWKSCGIILREVSPGYVVKTGWFDTEFSEDKGSVFPDATKLNLVAI